MCALPVRTLTQRLSHSRPMQDVLQRHTAGSQSALGRIPTQDALSHRMQLPCTGAAKTRRPLIQVNCCQVRPPRKGHRPSPTCCQPGPRSTLSPRSTRCAGPPCAPPPFLFVYVFLCTCVFVFFSSLSLWSLGWHTACQLGAGSSPSPSSRSAPDEASSVRLRFGPESGDACLSFGEAGEPVSLESGGETGMMYVQPFISVHNMWAAHDGSLACEHVPGEGHQSCDIQAERRKKHVFVMLWQSKIARHSNCDARARSRLSSR